MMESPGRIAFSIFGFDVMWYGILVALGIVCGFFVIYYRAPKYHGIPADRTFNLIILILIAALIGTRAYYVIFEWEYYGANPAEIFNFRAGGLAIHGGLIFGCLMAALLARIYKEKFFNIVDVFFVGIPLGQAIGRWGNFFNSEAHGTHTDLPWAIIVDGDTVHPTFLYESIWCLILVLILWRIDNNRKFVGQTFLLYCVLYSVERFFVEALRTDSLMVHFPWGDFKQAQVLSAVVIIAAAGIYILLLRRSKGQALLLAAGGEEEESGGEETALEDGGKEGGGEEVALEDSGKEGDEKEGGGDEAAPGGDDEKPGDEEAALEEDGEKGGGDDEKPGDEEAALGDDDEKPGDEEAALEDDEKESGDEEAAPGGDDKEGGGEEPAEDEGGDE